MRVAVFGRPGGGKSTLAQRIARAVQLPLYPVDLLRYAEGGAEVAPETFLARYQEVLDQPRWVMDGFASRDTFDAMVDRATVLVYVERPTAIHYWWVTKRFLLSPFSKPVGWPKNSPMWASTRASYRYLGLSGRFWTPQLKERLLAYRPAKQVYVIRTARDEQRLLNELGAVAAARP